MKIFADIKESIEQEWNLFEKLFNDSLLSESCFLNSLNRYLFESAGKQIRPLLALVTSRACSGSVNQQAVACATVSELIHTATLLHDDVVDNSDFRRGRRTVCKVFSPGVSLLLGDYWLTRAIHLLISYHCPNDVLAVYSRAIERLSEGEMIQMECADHLKTTEEDYLNIIRCKTSSLFIATVVSPAIVSGAERSVVEELRCFADLLGICFQIRDDILDYSSMEKTGKDSLSDIGERKITMPLFCAFRSAPDKEGEIRKLMSGIELDKAAAPENRKIIEEVRRFVLDQDGIRQASGILETYIAKAVSHLSVLEESVYRNHLQSIVEFLGLGS